MTTRKAYYLRRLVLPGLLLFLMLTFSESYAETAKPQQVWLMAGQSNMIGYGTRTVDLTPQQRRPHTDVKILIDAKTGWTDLAPGLGPNGNSFGPELAFGRLMASELPDAEVLLIKARFGLGNLYNDWRSPNTGRGPAGPHYARFITLVKKALTRKPDAKIAGMVWMQGEGDGYDDTNKAKSYAKNLKLFINSIRTDLKSPDMRFVIGQITKSKQWGFGEIVRRAQAEVARTNPNCVMVKTEDLPLCDGMHYTSHGCLELGKRFARKAVLDQKGN